MPATASTTAAPEAAVDGQTIVRFSAGDTHVDVTIAGDNATVRDFLSMLPLTLQFEEFNGREKVSYLPRPLDTTATGAPTPKTATSSTTRRGGTSASTTTPPASDSPTTSSTSAPTTPPPTNSPPWKPATSPSTSSSSCAAEVRTCPSVAGDHGVYVRLTTLSVLTTVSVVTGRQTLHTSECPVSRSVDVVGEWWSILIVRDSIDGITRFDDFRQHLGISPTMLTQRLRRLVDTGILRRRRYETRPPRDEYVLTPRGRELASVILALAGWWNDGVEPDRRPVIVIDHETGEEVEPSVIDRRTGRPIEWPRHRFGPGPTASRRAREVLATYDPDRAAS